MTHETPWAWRPSRRVFGLCRAYVCDPGLKGRFLIAPSAALGEWLATVTTHHAFI